MRLADNTVDAEETTVRLDAACAKARLGCAMIDFQDPMYHFGKWNDRPLNPSAQGALYHSMVTTGANTKRYENAIPLVVNRDDIDLATLVPITGVPNEVKTAKWTKEGLDVQAANGRHRHEAQKARLRTVQLEWEKADKHVKALTKADMSADDIVALDAAKEYREGRATYIAKLKMWVATFYDAGEYVRAHM